ncbi:MAG: hypothetical protein IJ684_05000 [Bacteroidales bacterium]|nr:hypothetical protein [Bacteroidales bacterium]
MKRTQPLALLLLILLPFTLWAQEEPLSTPTPGAVLDRYLDRLNHNAIRTDSTLFVETSIVSLSMPTDTMWMRRWFTPPAFHRVEIRRHDSLIFALHSDGEYIFREFYPKSNRWADAGVSYYYNQLNPYDVRGHLRQWQRDPIHPLRVDAGSAEGRDIYRVFVSEYGGYDRYYVFEKESGLLFFIDELASFDTSALPNPAQHVDWRAYHEYTPLGASLFVTKESYRQRGEVVVLSHRVRYIPFDLQPFKKD